jgi:hypothetical protein
LRERECGAGLQSPINCAVVRGAFSTPGSMRSAVGLFAASAQARESLFYALAMRRKWCAIMPRWPNSAAFDIPMEWDTTTDTQTEEPTEHLGMAHEIGSVECAGDMDVGAVVFALSNFNRLGIVVEPHSGQTHYRMSSFGYNLGLAVCDVSDLIRRDEVQISDIS